MKLFEHIKLVCTHKKYVFEACCKAGIPIQGFLHDMSKFSPTELFESVKYYTGDRSPIDNCKDINGYSLAWLHHKGRNKHHWEYWVDNLEGGMTPICIPFKYCLEMLCDFIGAGKAYKKEKFTYLGEWEWWQARRNKVVMHPIVNNFITICLYKLIYDENFLNYNNCLKVYNKCKLCYNNNRK